MNTYKKQAVVRLVENGMPMELATWCASGLKTIGHEYDLAIAVLRGMPPEKWIGRAVGSSQSGKESARIEYEPISDTAKRLVEYAAKEAKQGIEFEEART